MTKPIALVLAVALLGAAPAVTSGCAPAKAKDSNAPAANSAPKTEQNGQTPKAPPAGQAAAKSPVKAAGQPPAPANGRKPVAASRTPAGKVKVQYVGKPRLLPKKNTTHK